MSPCSRALRAFTLIELLVVVVIIALLLGILLPALSAAVGSARAVAGLSRLRDLALATDGYTTDHHGVIQRTSHSARVGFGTPQGLEWFQALAPYFDPTLDQWLPPEVEETPWLRVVNQHYRSPRDRFVQEPGQIDPARRPVLSYAQNVWFELPRSQFELGSGDPAEPFRKLVALPHPTRTVLFAELTEPYLDSLPGRITQGPAAIGAATDHLMAHFWKLFEAEPEEVVTPREGPPGGYVFADAHAATKPFEETFSLEQNRDLWDPRAVGTK